MTDKSRKNSLLSTIKEVNSLSDKNYTCGKKVSS